MVCHLLGGSGRRPPVAVPVRQLPVLFKPPGVGLMQPLVQPFVQQPTRPDAFLARPQAA